jgi:hypothetical protein
LNGDSPDKLAFRTGAITNCSNAKVASWSVLFNNSQAIAISANSTVADIALPIGANFIISYSLPTLRIFFKKLHPTSGHFTPLRIVWFYFHDLVATSEASL